MIDALFVGLSKTIETGDFQYLMSAYIRVLRKKDSILIGYRFR